MFDKDMRIAGYDDELSDAIQNERRRQQEHIELIASENYASPRVLEAQGSVLTNKYAEGYPGKRYYGGCEYVDVAEGAASPLGLWIGAQTYGRGGDEAVTAWYRFAVDVSFSSLTGGFGLDRDVRFCLHSVM